MNIQSNKIKVFGALTAVILVAVFGYYISTRRVGAQGDPEARLYSESGSESRAFSVGETGYLDLRAYSEGISGYEEKLDISIALDISGSMFDNIEGTSQKKIIRARNFLKSFIDEIDYSKEVQLSFVSFGTAVTDHSSLRMINDAGDKTFFKDIVNSFTTPGGHTETARAVDMANQHLIAGRPGAAKYILLVTDGGENPGGSHIFLNGAKAGEGVFDESWISNMDAGVVPGSILATSINNNIKYITVYANPNSDWYDYTTPKNDKGEIEYNFGNGGLMRFVSAKTNGVLMPNASRWDVRYGDPVASSLDEKYHYLFYENNIEDIYTFIEGQTGIFLDYYVKLPSQVSYEGVVQYLDKGGRTRDVTVTELGDSTYKITTKNLLPLRYQCIRDEADCIRNAQLGSDGSYWIEDNYLDVKLKVKFQELGSFDLLSNYTNCETGPLKKIAESSRVELIDPRDQSLYKTLYFDALCVKVLETSPGVVKVSYESDPGDDLSSPRAERKASFEAGDDVWTVLEVSSSSAGLTDWKVFDQVPSSAFGSLQYWYYQGGNKAKEGEVAISNSQAIFKGVDNGDPGAFIGQLSPGKNYIKYKYKI